MKAAARRLLGPALLALLPALAFAPAWWQERLLGPGDGAALHYPLKAAVWQAWRGSQLPGWDPAVFGGTSLLASYRAGALYPPVVVLAPLPPFLAFQLLVLGSLSAAAVLVYLYLRRLQAGPVGAYVAGLCFALGPYLVGHLDDTATLVAAPTLPLLLLAAESHVKRRSVGRAAGLALAIALNLLAGSPEAARAGLALLVGRLLIAHLFPAPGRTPDWRWSALAVGAGLLLAAPQVLPTLLAARAAGRQASGFANLRPEGPGGLVGLILRYVSHTPAAALALAALPLSVRFTTVRVLLASLLIALGLQSGRGPLSVAGALPLVFDLSLCVLAGLSLSEQWRLRLEPGGRRLRAYLLVSGLASAAALSLAAAVLGPLPQALAGAVGVLAIAQVLLFATITAKDTVVGGVFLLPLSVGLLLQPQAREAWAGAPTRELLRRGSATWQALARTLQAAPQERLLTLVRRWPLGEEGDLAYGGWAGLHGLSSVNGYDPLVPLRNRMAFEGMGPAGSLPGAFFRTDPGRLELLGVRWVLAPSSALAVPPDRDGLGENLDVVIEAGRPRSFPTPLVLAGELRLASQLSEAVELKDETPVARVRVQLASGREVPLVLRAGRETAEWAYDRPDVRAAVRHARAPVLESWPVPGEGFQGHRYLAALALPGRYLVAGLTIERLPGPGRLVVSRVGFRDAGGGLGLSIVSGFVSDSRFRESVLTPGVRLYELPGAARRVHVAERLRVFEGPAEVLAALRQGGALGLRPGRDALATAGDAAGLELGGTPGPTRPQALRSAPGRWDVRAEGPGLLVVGDGWDPGWSALVDRRAARVVRVNHVQLGVPLPAGRHRIELRYRPVGFRAGLALLALGVLGFAAGARALQRL